MSRPIIQIDSAIKQCTSLKILIQNDSVIKQCTSLKILIRYVHAYVPSVTPKRIPLFTANSSNKRKLKI